MTSVPSRNPANAEPVRSIPTLASQHPSAWLALSGLSLSMLLASLGTSSANVALPTLRETFDVSFQAVQWVVIAYLLATTMLIVSAGRLGDLIGRRRLLIAGLALFAGASALCGAAPTLWFLIVSRALQGVGAATVIALSLTFVGETVPREKTGSAMGLLGTMSAIGTALGPALGGILIAGFSWRAIFFANVPLSLLALLPAYRYLPADRPRSGLEKPGFDVPGALLLALVLGAYALTMTTGRGSFGVLSAALLMIAVAGLGLFLHVEAKTETPLIRLSLLRDRVLSSGLTMSGLVSTVMMATLVVGPFYLAKALSLSVAQVGAVMSVGPLVVAIAGVPVGRTIDRLGAGHLTLIGVVAMTAGSLLLAAIPSTLGVLGYLAPIIVITLGYATFQTANNTAVMKDVHADQRGVISGMLNLSRNLGLITGASVMGAIFAYVVGTSDSSSARPEDVASGMRTTFAVATVLLAAAVLIAIRSQRTSLTRPSDSEFPGGEK